MALDEDSDMELAQPLCIITECFGSGSSCWFMLLPRPEKTFDINMWKIKTIEQENKNISLIFSNVYLDKKNIITLPNIMPIEACYGY
jgi:hypothetical protein